ncbi:MAG: lamin tail domain-containing protein, partial [Myxococcales bacterium]|nr:lamin tail domain-containing protein [Myxococcales bacterium]
DAGTDAGPPVPPLLYFTEYVEGTSNDKALEFINAGLTDVNLSGCELRRYANGGLSPLPIPLVGTVAMGDVFVICHSAISVATACDQSISTISHNGNDAYELVCFGTVLDSFGRVGEDPGSAWTGGGLSTLDYVLTRQCSIASGDPISTDAFDPSTEWTGTPYTTPAASLAGLGNRSECP